MLRLTRSVILRDRVQQRTNAVYAIATIWKERLIRHDTMTIGYFSTCHRNNQVTQRRFANYDFSHVVEGIRVFQKEYGHSCVPIGFTVPENSPIWPIAMAKYPLGKRLRAFMSKDIHQRKNPSLVDALREVGIPSDQNYREFEWENVFMKALTTHKALYGHVCVQCRFRVPTKDNAWPSSTWGMRLGARVRVLRKTPSRLLPNEITDLNSVGFEWDEKTAHMKVREMIPRRPRREKKKRKRPIFAADDFSHLIDGLKLFKQQYGHVIVSRSFFVPNGNDEPSNELSWPLVMEGYPLGFKLCSMMDNKKYRKRHPEMVQALTEMGIPLDISYNEFLWKYRLMPALGTFHSINGHLLVSTRFVVPTKDERWPPATWGMKLGNYVDSLRPKKAQLNQTAIKELEEIGFVWSVSEYRWSEMILPSLRTYKQEYGDCFVPIHFIVPSHSPWPKRTWGLSLGAIVFNMRTNGYYSHRDLKELEPLGFVWDYYQSQWKTRILPALCVYKQVYGKPTIPYSFTVPSELPWPENVWNFNLGILVDNIRRGGGYQNQIKQDQEILTEIGMYTMLTSPWIK